MHHKWSTLKDWGALHTPKVERGEEKYIFQGTRVGEWTHKYGGESCLICGRGGVRECRCEGSGRQGVSMWIGFRWPNLSTNRIYLMSVGEIGGNKKRSGEWKYLVKRGGLRKGAVNRIWDCGVLAANLCVLASQIKLLWSKINKINFFSKNKNGFIKYNKNDM